jgi:hypothetical protein
MLPDFERVDRIGEFWSYPHSRAFAELLIDCEEDRTLPPVALATGEDPERLAGRKTLEIRDHDLDEEAAAGLQVRRCVPEARDLRLLRR